MDRLTLSGSPNQSESPRRLPDQKTGIALVINGYGRPGDVNARVPLPTGWREDVALTLLAEQQVRKAHDLPEDFDFGQARVFVNDSTKQIGIVFRARWRAFSKGRWLRR